LLLETLARVAISRADARPKEHLPDPGADVPFGGAGKHKERVMAGPEERTDKSLIEENWVLGAMLGVLLILGVALGWLATHPDNVAAWGKRDATKTRVEKPTAVAP